MWSRFNWIELEIKWVTMTLITLFNSVIYHSIGEQVGQSFLLFGLKNLGPGVVLVMKTTGS
jgi:hypothetical protein